jgi:hypothetical protein
MRFLFVLRHAAYIRSLETTIRGLCARGHEARILLGRSEVAVEGPAESLARLELELDGVTVGAGVEPRGSRRRDLAGALRCWLDYLFFLGPEFTDAPKLRARSRRALPDWLADGVDASAGSPEFIASVAAAVSAFERTIPVPEPIRALVAGERPDALIPSPLIERRSPQVGYVRVARELGIPTALCVRSWDNLTTSGLIHEAPDLVTVWNEAQKREAVELHGIPADRIAVTGAGMYDEWFEQRLRSPRAEFCARAGLPHDRPFLLYACSSSFIAPEEASWIVHWISRIRAQPGLAEVPVLVRPHPGHVLLDGSTGARKLLALPRVAVYPRERSHPTIAEALPDYYDALHHAAAVIGVNTSAMIEAAMAGTGVYVLLSKRYGDTQTGAPHFAHLRTAGGGLIDVTDDIAEHAAALVRALRGEDRDAVTRRSKAFLSAFIRPLGMDRPATPILVDELERLAAAGGAPVRLAPGPPADQVAAAVAALEAAFRIPDAGRLRSA